MSSRKFSLQTEPARAKTTKIASKPLRKFSLQTESAREKTAKIGTRNIAEEKETISLFGKVKHSFDYGSIDKKQRKLITKNNEYNKNDGVFKLILNSLTRWDKFLLVVAIANSIICGICPPLLGYFFGAMTNVYVRHTLQLEQDSNITTITEKPQYITSSVEHYNQPVFTNYSTVMYETVRVIRDLYRKNVALYNIWDTSSLKVPISNDDFRYFAGVFGFVYFILGTILFVATFLQSICWNILSKRIIHRLRQVLYNQTIRQEVAWHSTSNMDANSRSNLANKLQDIQAMITNDCGSIVQHASTFISGILVGLSINPRLTLVTSVIGPFLFLISAYMTKLTNKSKEPRKKNSKIGNKNNSPGTITSSPEQLKYSNAMDGYQQLNAETMVTPINLTNKSKEPRKKNSKVGNKSNNLDAITSFPGQLRYSNDTVDCQRLNAETTVTPINASVYQTNVDSCKSNTYRSSENETNESDVTIEEALSNVKLISAFGKQSSEANRYRKMLNANFEKTVQIYRRIALCIGLSNTLQFLSYCLAFFYGSYLIQAGISLPGSVFTVFFSIISGSFSAVNVLPSLNTVALTSDDASCVADVINRKARIDSYATDGLKLIRFQGYIEFKNVSFSYPTTPSVMALRNINLKFEPGKITAIVGCKDSKLFSLFELLVRHYEPTDGQIYLDGVPIHDFNISWLRKQISLLPKKPVLFNVSIAENIRYAKDDCSIEEIQQAAKLIHAEQLISNLPQGYETLIDDEEVSLSEAEKQKIAIARALVMNRKIILLEETADVFTEEEERAFLLLLVTISKHHTTLLIPHRVRMARYADVICVLKDGCVAEYGTHVELVEKQGLYSNMIATEADFESDAYRKQLDDICEITNDEKTPERIEPEEHETPCVLLKKYEDNDDEYDIKFYLPGGLDESDLKPINETESSNSDDESLWKVLRRSVSEEALNEDTDDEFNTVVTHVREKRLIKYTGRNDEDDTDSENDKVLNESVSDDLQELDEDVDDEDVDDENVDDENVDDGDDEDEDETSSIQPLNIKKPEVTQPIRKPAPKSRQQKQRPKDPGTGGTLEDIWLLQKPEWLCLILIFIACLISGLVTPFVAFYYGKVYQIYTLTGDLLRSATAKWACIFLGLSVLFGLNLYLQSLLTSKTSEVLIKRLKVLTFENILRHPVCWFDENESSSTVKLKNHLSDDIPLIKPLCMANVGNALTYVVTLACSLIIGRVYGWKLCIDLVISVPIVLGLSYVERILLDKKRDDESQSIEESEKLATESLNNISTVHALGQEKRFTELYCLRLELSRGKGMLLMVLCSLMCAIIRSLIIYLYSVGFKIGNNLVIHKEMSTSGVYMVYFSVCFCTTVLCTAFTRTRDYVKAKRVLDSSFYLLKKETDIDVDSIYGAKPVIEGNISFHNVTFYCPSQPDTKILDGVDLKLSAGKFYAFFGESKCGKSFIGYLIERFYDPDEGSVCIDDYDMKTLNVSHLREHIGLVTQEPVIFDRSIRENIAFGSISPNSDDCVLFFEIEKAAKLANVHNFIVSLPQGYDTQVGTTGVQLSRDQKQRIAIARAVVRNPKILVLDEPSSMLDEEGTKIVRKALDNVRFGRTTIVMSRDVNMVRNADLIFVMYKGRVLESGNHQRLLEKGGYYSRLYNA